MKYFFITFLLFLGCGQPEDVHTETTVNIEAPSQVSVGTLGDVTLTQETDQSVDQSTHTTDGQDPCKECLKVYNDGIENTFEGCLASYGYTEEDCKNKEPVE